MKVNHSDSLLFLFDTGANGSAIDIHTSDQLNLKTVKTDTVEGSAGFIIVQPQQGYFARTDAVGFFGNNLLEKFKKVTIDFLEKKMYISYNSSTIN